MPTPRLSARVCARRTCLGFLRMKTRYIARSPMVAARELGGEMVIMSAIDSSLFTLNEVASLIWKSADGTASLQEIVRNKVCVEFDVDPDVALSDAEHL